MQHTLTFADIQNVKRHAKHLKHTYPELPHAKRLDIAAAELARVRNYHELNCQFDEVINRDVDTPGSNSVSHCRYCDFRFAVDHKPDLKEHRDLHERFMEVHEKLGYRPGTYAERERMKKDGYQQANHAEQVEDRVAGLLMITRGWFDRSFHAAVSGGYWAKHPSFEEYTAMMTPHLETIYPALAAIVAERYGRTPGVIPKGNTYWPAR